MGIIINKELGRPRLHSGNIFTFDKLVNTRYFREPALTFLKTGKYTDAPKGHPDYEYYWDVQENRCRNGLIIGDLWVTGRMYFYLNFVPIKKVPDPDYLAIHPHASKTRKVQTFPSFWEIDYAYWNTKELGWQNAELGIPEVHMVILKTRRGGFSFKEAADGVYNYNFFPRSISAYYSASKKYLVEDGIFNKVEAMLDHLNVHTAWAKNRQRINNKYHKRASYLDGDNEKGFMSELIAQVMDTPDKGRGGDSMKITFEEGGSFPSLLAAWEINAQQVKQSSIFTGQMCGFGCVCKGTKVWDAQGNLVNIEDLKQTDGILGYDVKNEVISREEITYMQPPAKKPCVEIKMMSGRVLRCSTDHPIFSSKPEETIQRRNKKENRGWCEKKVYYTEAGKLKTGDQVAVIGEVPVFGDYKMWGPRLLGLLVGDGYYGKDSTPVISNADKEINEFVYKNFDAVLERGFLTKEGKEYKESRIRGICKYLRKEGIYGQTKDKKTLPKYIHSSSREDICEFLGGLYDADGYIKKGDSPCIILTSAYENLLKEVQLVLQKLGIWSIITRIKKSKKPGTKDRNDYFRLNISTAEGIIRFSENIKLLTVGKQKRLHEIASFKSYITAHTSKRPAINKGFWFDRVISIEDIGVQDIYNLTAGNTHTYIANGILTHNTGGTKVDHHLEGLEELFYNPAAYDVIPFDNIWDEGLEGTDCGFFCPVHYTFEAAMDPDGNVDMELADKLVERERKRKTGSKSEKQFTAENPKSPTEALQRNVADLFPAKELKKRVQLLRASPNMLDGIMEGTFRRGPKGLEFHMLKKGGALDHYPPGYKGEPVPSAICIEETPKKDNSGKVPEGWYQVTVDFYTKEHASESDSVGCVWVQKTGLCPFGVPDMPVAWYVGRPKNKDTIHQIVLDLAEYYGATIQSEVLGGGSDFVTYAKTKNKLHILCTEVEVGTTKVKQPSGMNYFMNMPVERKTTGLDRFSEWLVEPIGIDVDGNTILRYQRINWIMLLEECMKFRYEGNFDCISAGIIQMFMRQVRQINQERSKKAQRKTIFNRPKFGQQDHSQYKIDLKV